MRVGIRKRDTPGDLRFFSALIGIGLRFFQCHDVRLEPTLVAEEVENHANPTSSWAMFNAHTES